MSGFLDDHDDFELARRLRRAAGPTPDVYVAYDSVVTRVGTVRRRRRLVTTGAAGLVLVFGATSYVVNLQTSDRTIKTASATTDPPDTTEPVVLGSTSTVAVPTTLDGDGLAGGPPADDVTTTSEEPPATTEAPETSEPPVTEPEPLDEATAAEVTPPADSNVPTLPPQTVPPTTAKPKPKPPATLPPATVPPTDPPVETTVPPVETTVPPTTVPPTVPPTAPPTTAPPTTTPPTEPTVPVPVLTEMWASAEGNRVTVLFQNSQLSFVLVQPAEGWTSTTSYVDNKHIVATFTAPDLVTVVTVNVTVKDGKIQFG